MIILILIATPSPGELYKAVPAFAFNPDVVEGRTEGRTVHKYSFPLKTKAIRMWKFSKEWAFSAYFWVEPPSVALAEADNMCFIGRNP